RNAGVPIERHSDACVTITVESKSFKIKGFSLLSNAIVTHASLWLPKRTCSKSKSCSLQAPSIVTHVSLWRSTGTESGACGPRTGAISDREASLSASLSIWHVDCYYGGRRRFTDV